LWLALRDVDLAEVPRTLVSANPLWLSLALGSVFLPVACVTLRMRVLLSAWSRSLPWATVWHVTIVGQVSNLAVPFRLGDGAKVIAGSRAFGLGAGALTAVVAVERLLDLANASGLAGLLLLTGQMPGWAETAAGGLVVAGGSAVAVAVIAATILTRWRGTAPPQGGGIRGRVLRLLDQLHDGLDHVRKPRVLLRLILVTLCTSAASALTNYLMMRAFSLPVPYTGALLLLIVLQLGNTVIPAPGGVGTSQLLAIQTLALWSVSPEDALAYSIALYVIVRLPKVAMLPHATAVLSTVTTRSTEASRWA
jgi:uncharacterized protein (TIRG00374 family)